MKTNREIAEEQIKIQAEMQSAGFNLELMKKSGAFCLLILSVYYLALFIGIQYGKSSKQREIENRAKEVNKECITNQELEVIIFGEKQE